MKKTSDVATLLEKQIEHLDLLREVAKNLVDERDLDELAKRILEGANRLIPFTDGSIGLVDEGIITFPYAVGNSAAAVKKFRIKIGEGLTGSAVQEKVPIRIGDISKDKRYRDQIKTTKSELDVPIIYDGEGIGLINIESTEIDAFSEADERLLVALAEHAAIAVNNARLFGEMTALRDINKQLASTLNFETVLDKILETASGLIKCPEMSVGVLDSKTNTLRFTLARGPSKASVLSYSPTTAVGLTGWAVREKKAVRVGDVTKDPRYLAQIGSTRSELDVPLLIGDEVYGVLNAESPNINAFNNHDEHLLIALADQAALAVRNAKLYDEVKKELEITREREIDSEKMAAIGDVAGNIVHRMNNYVTAIRTNADIMKLTIAGNDSGKIGVQEIVSGINIIHEIANKVLADVRAFRERYTDVEPIPLEINKILRACLDEMILPKEIVVLNEFGTDLPKVYGAEVHLKEVFRNLFTNAISSMSGVGQLFIESKRQGKNVIVRIRDTGVGISDEILPHIFEFGYTTKQEGQGLGYGLWWVKTYLNVRGGDIKVEETKLGLGSTFLVRLPEYEDKKEIKETDDEIRA